MGETGGRHHVADRVDAGLARAHERIDRDEPALVQLDGGRLEADILGDRPAPYRHQQQIGLQRLGLLAPEAHPDPGLRDLAALHRHAGARVDAALLERLGQLHAHVGIFVGDEPGERFQERHLGAERAVDGRELASHRARADHDQRLGNLGKLECFVGGDDALAVPREERKHLGIGAGGDEHESGGQRFAAARVEFHLDLARPPQAAVSFHDIDLPLLHQGADRRRESAHGLRLLELRLLPVEGEPLGFEPVALHGAELVVEGRGLQQELGRDAPAQEAGPAERPIPLHDRGLEPELRRAHRGHVAARTGADHHQVVRSSIRHRATPSLRGQIARTPPGSGGTGEVGARRREIPYRAPDEGGYSPCGPLTSSMRSGK